MSAKKQQVIRIHFPDGWYSFWMASTEKDGSRIWFRVKESGRGGSRTPKERLENLVKELGSAGYPEAAVRYAKYTIFRPADMTQVIGWLRGHHEDLYDLIDKRVSSKVMR